MFDSVLGRGVGARGRPGVGAAVSLSLHALVFAAALLTVAPHPPPAGRPAISWPLPKGPRATGQRATPLPPVRPQRLEAPHPRPPVPSVASASSAEPAPAAPGVSSGTDGPGESGVEAPCSLQPCSPEGAGSQGGTVYILGPEMTAPRLLSSPVPRYPAAALLQQLGGTVVVRCTVTERGTVQQCGVVKSIPLLDEAALQAVSGRRYAPALYEGHPVSVWMYLPVRFVVP